MGASKNTPDNIKKDKVLKEYYDKVKSILEDEIHEVLGNNASMVQDIYGGCTNNKIAPDFNLYDQAGHKTKYWWDEKNNSTYNQMKEGWAEYFAAMIRNDAYNIKKNAEFFPLSAGEEGTLEKLADALYKDYLDRCREQYGS